jgi:hypothetical protein
MRTDASTDVETSAKRRAIDPISLHAADGSPETRRLGAPPHLKSGSPAPNLELPAFEPDRAQGTYADLPVLELVRILNQRLRTIGASLDNGAPPVYEETMGN